MGPGSKEAPRLSTEDTASYILGLLLVVVGEYLVLRQPHLFLHLYTAVITILICRRWVLVCWCWCWCAADASV